MFTPRNNRSFEFSTRLFNYVNQQDIQYFVLIIPGCLLLLGIAFVICRFMLRDQVFLSWIAAGYILPAIALAAQSMMTNQQLEDWSVIAAIFYLFGIWAIAQGMALRKGGNAHPRLALLISAVTLILLFYYSQVESSIWMRIMVINTSLGLIQLLVAKLFLANAFKGDPLDKTLSTSYLIIIIYTLARPLVIALTIEPDNIGELTQSNYWLLMLSVSMLLSLWLALLIIAITVRDIMNKMNDERYRDSLTFLLNRRGFFEAAKDFMGSVETNRYFLLTCDIDHFKHVNDNWGHLTGDKVLQKVSKTIVKNVRDDDLVARFGGEEFVIFLRGADMPDARKIAERIRTEIAAITFANIPITVTASFGLVEITTLHDLIKTIDHADTLLYNAKQNGRNQICWD